MIHWGVDLELATPTGYDPELQIYGGEVQPLGTNKLIEVGYI